MAPLIVLISGANRGLGKGLLQLYLAKPNHIVIAANRNPEHATSKALADLPTGPGSRLIVVKTDASVELAPFEAVTSIAAYDIDHLDLVIANAGVSYVWPKASDLKIADLQGHLTPNVFGVVWLYQATLPLLLKSTNPKWVTMESSAGWLEVYFAESATYPNAAYATSKVAVHWLTKRMNAEEDKLTAFAISPGWCQTDMGNTGAQAFGMGEAPIKVEDSCSQMVPLIEGTTKESHGGKLWNYEGDQMTW